jgi:hypothetical protein
LCRLPIELSVSTLADSLAWFWRICTSSHIERALEWRENTVVIAPITSASAASPSSSANPPSSLAHGYSHGHHFQHMATATAIISSTRLRPRPAISANVRRQRRGCAAASRKPLSSVNQDGLVCVTTFRTRGLKKPMIGLLFTNRILCTRDGSKTIAGRHR